MSVDLSSELLAIAEKLRSLAEALAPDPGPDVFWETRGLLQGTAARKADTPRYPGREGGLERGVPDEGELGAQSHSPGDIVASPQAEKVRREVAAISAQRDALLAELEKLTNLAAEGNREAEDASNRSRECDARLQNVRNEIRQAKAELAHVGEDQERQRATLEQIESLEKQLAEQKKSIESGREDLRERGESLAKREADLSSREDWLKSLLPSWLCADGIGDRGEVLLRDARESGSASSGARLVLATMSLYHQTAKESDARALADALRDLSRRLFVWLKARGVEPYDAAGVAEAFAKQINSECAGRCEIEVPVPGAPAVNQTMLFQPRGGVSAQTISSVQSWCVRGAKREVIHRAAVTV